MKVLGIVVVVGSMLFTFARESEAKGVIYESQHALLVDAIRNGHADGVMAGETAQAFSKQFKSRAPLLARADVVESFARSDCKRLAVAYTQTGLDGVGGKGKGSATMHMKLNYCADGKPPSESEKGVGR